MPFWLKLLATRSENYFSQPTLERRLSNTVSWSHLDLRGSTWSYTCTSAIVDTGYQSRQESLRICALAVAVVEAQSPSRLSFIVTGVASCSRPACDRIGPSWGGVFEISSIVEGSGPIIVLVAIDPVADFPFNCRFYGRVFAVHATSSVTKRSVVLEEVPICVCPKS